MLKEHTKRRECNQAQPCLVCQGTHGCSTGEDGLIMCRRRQGAQMGFRFIGEARGMPGWGLYRTNDDPRLYTNSNDQGPHNPRVGRKEKAEKSAPRIPWLLAAQECQVQLTEPRRAQLALALGLPVSCTYAIPRLGFKKDTRHGDCWTFPECDGNGEITALVRRLKNGQKRVMAGGKRGLTIPAGWEEAEGPLFIPEGASDVLALSALGLAAVGRPNDQSAAPLLVDLLRDQPEGRQLIVLGEWDPKPDGRWPGLEGARKIAGELAAGLKRSVHWALPPDGAKDTRAWASALGGAAESPELWPTRGKRFLDSLKLQEVKAVPVEEEKEGLVLTSFDKVEREVVRWLVPGYIPKGKMCVIAGDGGEGKSLVTAHLMAALTTGTPAFGLQYAPPTPCDVIVANCEDHRADTQLPRLEAAGADLTRVHQVEGVRDKDGKLKPFNFLYLQQIRESLRNHPNIGLIIIDPASSYIAATGANDNSDPEVRLYLDPLSKICEEFEVTVMLVKHFNKSTGGKASHKMSGAVSYRNASRVAFMVFPHPSEEGKKLFLCDKINGGAKPVGLVYQIQLADRRIVDRVRRSFDEKWNDADRALYLASLATVNWCGETDYDTNTVCSEEGESGNENWAEVDKAALWLKKFLRDGARPGPECTAAGNEDNELVQSERWWREKVLRKRCGGRSRKAGKDGGWFWCLPGQEPPEVAEVEEAESVESAEEAESAGGGPPASAQ